MTLAFLKGFDPSRMSRHERLLAVGGGLIVSLLVMDRLVLGPWWRHMHHVREDIQRLERSITKYQELMVRQPHLAAEAEGYRHYLPGETAAEPDLASILRDIEALGNQSGLVLGEVKPVPGEDNGAYQTYAVEVQYRGSMEQWVQFLYLIESSKALLDIERATVSVKEEQDIKTLEGSVRLTGRIIHRTPSA